MVFILIGNYPKDKQESMERFALMLHSGFINAGYQTALWRPTVILGGITKSNKGFGKWLGYIDKWIIFPLILAFRRRQSLVKNNTCLFHICDHSNSPYLKVLPSKATGITCHDVLAIKGALGFSETYCEATRLGKLLQKVILQNLLKAEILATVSNFTMKQLLELSQEKLPLNKDWRIIPNAFNANFHPTKSNYLLKKAGVKTELPFILHVGSALPRKNRKTLLLIVAQIIDKWKGQICFAGEAIEEELWTMSINLGIRDRLISVVNPDHDTLLALYSDCNAFIFPSFSEGFGWPVIEAQACGAPVIASNIDPLIEIGGAGAIFADPAKPSEFAEALLSLQTNKIRSELIQKGFENTASYSRKNMITSYLNLYGLTN